VATMLSSDGLEQLVQCKVVSLSFGVGSQAEGSRFLRVFVQWARFYLSCL
jgi:hypothetical protein